MSWGRNSIILSIAIGNGVVLAVLLWQAGAHRAFLRPLAVLVALIALRLVPYAIGFAGAYDQYQWLTFAPFDWSMAFGPLVWMYIRRLSTAEWPSRWLWHVVPVLLQVTYQLAAFALPLETKWNWYTTTHRDVIEPIGFGAVLVSLFLYVFSAWRQFVIWQQWMDDQLSNREAYRLGVVRVVLIGTAVVALLAALFALRSWFVSPTDYFDRLPMMLALAMLGYVLALAGWQQSGMVFPVITPHAQLPTDLPAKPTGRPRQDFAALGAEWRARTIAAQWYRDPGLTLPDFAEKLSVSPRTASRVLRDGLGLSFNAFVNGLRVEDVRRQLSDPANDRDLLPIALDAGFASKASFNRAFRELTGVTPSSLRVEKAENGDPVSAK